MPSNLRQAAAVLHTRVAIKEPVGVNDRHIFLSLAGVSVALAGPCEVWAFTPVGAKISATAASNFILRLLPLAENYTINLCTQVRHDG
jgi:hypothetical protein